MQGPLKRIFLALAPAGLLALGLSACAPQTSLWSAAEQPPRQNKVEHVRLTHAMSFAPRARALDAAETQRLEDFLHRQKVGYGDKVTLIVSAEASPLAKARREALLKLLHRDGLYDVAVREGEAPAAWRDQATLVVGRYIVIPPACPDWSKPSGSDFTNTVGSNFGCASAVNLGMMVANPGDLVQGETLGPADGSRATLGIDRYRAGKAYAPSGPSSGSGVGGSPSMGSGGAGAGGSSY